MAVTKDVITGVRLGRATSVKRVKRAVQMIVDQVLNNETSLVGLTTIRDYDEYTFTHSVEVRGQAGCCARGRPDIVRSARRGRWHRRRADE